MKTFIKWPGGKDSELVKIREKLPKFSGRYVEPFVGGGAVFFDITSKEYFINDKSNDLISLYKCVKNKDLDFYIAIKKYYSSFRSIDDFIDNNVELVLNVYLSKITVSEFLHRICCFFSDKGICCDLLEHEIEKNLKSKIERSILLEYSKGQISDVDRVSNIEAALKSAYYMYVRHLYNGDQKLSEGHRAALFFFIREYCYSSMFRYNKKGEFNVPYGGISYNRKDFQKKISYIESDKIRTKLSKTQIYNEDFEKFVEKLNLCSDDFMFLDPPYDTDFSTYDQNCFDKEDQKRLASMLKKTKAKFMLVIKNTEFIYDLYKDNFNISSFDKKYQVSFKNRNEKQVRHLLITNY